MRQDGLYEHWEGMHQDQQRDFRARALNRLVARAIDSSTEVLDVGCGTCGFVIDMLKHGQPCRGVDSSEEMLSMGRRLLAAEGLATDGVECVTLGKFAARNVEQIPQAVCMDVLEHIEDDAGALRHLHAMLRRGAGLVVTVPAMPSLYGPKDLRVGHHRRYTRARIKELLPQDEWTIQSMRYWNLLGVPFTWYAVKIRKRAINETLRQHGGGALARTAVAGLTAWFTYVENTIRPPCGLTLVVHVTKK